MQLDIDVNEAKDIIKALLDNNKEFLANRIEQVMNKDIGSRKRSPSSNSRSSYHDPEFGYGHTKDKRY